MTPKFLTIAALVILPASAWAQTSGTQGETQKGSPSAPPSAPAESTTAAGAAIEEAATDAQAAAPAQAGPVTAATAADIRAGVSVRDPQGGVVGSIESVDAESAVVSTGSVRAKLPLTAFGKNGQGLVISLTKAEFETAARAQASSEDRPQTDTEDQQ